MDSISAEERKSILRILDANSNRCAEGLRVIEEMARFVIQDQKLLREIKDIRHAVRRNLEALSGGSYLYRDSEHDVGGFFSSGSEKIRGSLESVSRANFLRAEEALRVLEELSKLLSATAAEHYKNLRFRLYTVEKSILSSPDPAVAWPVFPFLYAILDRSLVSGEKIGETAADLAEGGAGIIQYRAKTIDRAGKREDLLAVVPRLRGKGVPLVVNDDPELCRETGADGVHLGMSDPSPREARSVVGPGKLIGLTVHSLRELEETSLEEVDYLGLGAIYPTPTKPKVKPVGTGFISRVRTLTDLPLVAIGGINIFNLEEPLEAGADGVALLSALLEGDVRKNCFTCRQIIDRRKKVRE
ncbi:MAG: thiamine phosphate synthase [Candidatus Krumholzibacteriota bacterium]|nr:thiamine phosphate synthase [Candidatus Krumholzibacteriota bacterium]